MPVLTVIAGPNGSGKSTLTQTLSFEGKERLLDPDAIARTGLSAIESGREVLERIAEYFRQGVSFAVETTLSGHGRLQLIRDAKTRGYRVHLAFVALDSPERSISRIKIRVAEGGHMVPDADVRRRYQRSLSNIRQAIDLADLAECYDNSGNGHELVLVARSGQIVWTRDPLPAWVDAFMKKGQECRSTPARKHQT